VARRQTSRRLTAVVERKEGKSPDESVYVTTVALEYIQEGSDHSFHLMLLPKAVRVARPRDVAALPSATNVARSTKRKRYDNEKRDMINDKDTIDISPRYLAETISGRKRARASPDAYCDSLAAT